MKLKIITYYSRKAGFSVRFLDDRIIGIPLEVYIPEKKIAIEFCGSRLSCGTIWMKESNKNLLCLKNEIKMFRIMPPEEKGFDTCTCFIMPQDNIMNFGKALSVIRQIILCYVIQIIFGEIQFKMKYSENYLALFIHFIFAEKVLRHIILRRTSQSYNLA